MSRHLKLKKKVSLGAAFVLLAVMAGACGSGDDDSGSSGSDGETASQEVQAGGTAGVIVASDPRSLDPALQFNEPNTGGVIESAIFDALFTVDLDGNVEPRIAESFETEDGTTWTLKLTDGVKFTDGTPFNAEAVKAEWTRIGNPDLQSVNGQFVANIAKMTATDDLTLEIQLKEPNYQFHQIVAVSALTWIPSPTAVEKMGEEFGNKPVGAGPFMVTDRQPNVKTTMAKNPDFYKDGMPYLDGLEFTFNGDQLQATDAISAGQAALTAPADVETRDMAEQNGLGTEVIPVQGVIAWIFNQNKPPFDDPRAREAVYNAIDTQKINEQAYAGLVDAPTSMFTEDSPLYDSEHLFDKPDPERAQELFDELADEGKPVKVVFPYSDSTYARKEATALETQLAEFDNVEIESRPTDPAGIYPVILAGDFGMLTIGAMGNDPEPIFTTAFGTGGGANFGGISVPAIDDALAAGRGTADVDERRAAYSDLIDTVNEEHVAVWFRTPNAQLGSAVFDPKYSTPDLYPPGIVLFDSWGMLSGS